MTKKEAAIVTAYTGVMLGDFSVFHAYAEEKLGGPIFTHQFADKELTAALREAAKEDFIGLEIT